MPSVAIFSPGRTTKRSPTASSATGTSTSTPSRSTRASFAPSSSSSRTAAPARRLARSSRYRPRRISVVMTAPTSKYVSASMPASSTTVDHVHAASVPMEMSVSIVTAKWRALSAAARWNGQPAHRTTGVASASAAHSQPSNWSGGTIASNGERERQRDCRDEPAQDGRALSGRLAVEVSGVTRRRHGIHEVGQLDLPRVVDDLRLLGCVVHGATFDAFDAGKLLLDADRARRAGHAADVEENVCGRRGGHAAS